MVLCNSLMGSLFVYHMTYTGITEIELYQHLQNELIFFVTGHRNYYPVKKVIITGLNSEGGLGLVNLLIKIFH